MLRPINTITELIEHARQNNGWIGREVLVASGLGSMGAVAAELRRRGYRARVNEESDRIAIIEYPDEGAARRGLDQTSMLDLPATTHVPRHGWGDDPD